jgi:hypothetical protein
MDMLQLFNVLVPHVGAARNFTKLMHFACLTKNLSDNCPLLQLLHDKTVPVLEQALFEMSAGEGMR